MSQSNPYHPLPSDYGQLTKVGQKEARVSIIRDQSTPEKLVDALVWEGEWSFDGAQDEPMLPFRSEPAGE